MLWSTQLLEHPEAVAAADDHHADADLWSLVPGHYQHPGLCLVDQEIPLDTARKSR